MKSQKYSTEAGALIRRIYGDHHGWCEIRASEEALVEAAQSSSVYGEITPGALAKLLDYLSPDEHDVFYDLGSGIGKATLQAALQLPFKKCVGIEILPSRHYIAKTMLQALRREAGDLLMTKDIEFRRRDILKTSLEEASIIYCCSTAFPFDFVERLTLKLTRRSKPLTYISLMELEELHGFRHIDTLTLDMSWRRRSKVYIYHYDPEDF